MTELVADEEVVADVAVAVAENVNSALGLCGERSGGLFASVWFARAHQHRHASAADLTDRYALVTLHRPANVDDGVRLKGILESLLEVNKDLTVIFPAHPRTRKRIDDFGLNAGQLRLLDPCPYVDFLGLQTRATVAIL